jgi:TPR repeat protein
MKQHGYPTKDEQDRLARLSETELELEAKQGKLTAMTELGSRMIDRNDADGTKWLRMARDRGSIYAYYEVSKREMNRTLGHGLVESGAFLRVAYLLGDYKAATALYQFASKEGLSIGELELIDRRAASLYITYAKNRQPVPRPFE